MGRRFYEHTMPELVRQLARLNELLERIATNTASAPTGGEETSGRGRRPTPESQEPLT